LRGFVARRGRLELREMAAAEAWKRRQARQQADLQAVTAVDDNSDAAGRCSARRSSLVLGVGWLLIVLSVASLSGVIGL
jgi:hypothetical protein